MSTPKPQLPLSDEQLEHLVERVTEKVIQNVYTTRQNDYKYVYTF